MSGNECRSSFRTALQTVLPMSCRIISLLHARSKRSRTSAAKKLRATKRQGQARGVSKRKVAASENFIKSWCRLSWAAATPNSVHSSSCSSRHQERSGQLHGPWRTANSPKTSCACLEIRMKASRHCIDPFRNSRRGLKAVGSVVRRSGQQSWVPRTVASGKSFSMRERVANPSARKLASHRTATSFRCACSAVAARGTFKICRYPCQASR